MARSRQSRPLGHLGLLPLELRLRIYRHLLHDNTFQYELNELEKAQQITHSPDSLQSRLLQQSLKPSTTTTATALNSGCPRATMHTAILRTCRKIHTEAFAVLYGEHTFHFLSPCQKAFPPYEWWQHPTPNPLQATLLKFPLRSLPAIRDLQLTHDGHNTFQAKWISEALRSFAAARCSLTQLTLTFVFKSETGLMNLDNMVWNSDIGGALCRLPVRNLVKVELHDRTGSVKSELLVGSLVEMIAYALEWTGRKSVQNRFQDGTCWICEADAKEGRFSGGGCWQWFVLPSTNMRA